MAQPPDLRVLRAFVVIAEERSITRAAARLHITQQSVSAQMRVLESRLGAALLVRSSRGVTLTAVGEVLLREAVPLLGSAERAMDAVTRSARGQALDLRVGFLSSMANEVMPPVVSLFTNENPGIELHAADLGIADLVAGVRARHAGCGGHPATTRRRSAQRLARIRGSGDCATERTRVGPQEISAVGRSCRPTVGDDTAHVVATVAPPVRPGLRGRGVPSAHRPPQHITARACWLSWQQVSASPASLPRRAVCAAAVCASSPWPESERASCC